MENITAKTPWKDHLGEVPFHLDYFEGSMFEAVAAIAEKYPNNVAFDFMGRSTTYKTLVKEIEQCAKALKTIGVREGDRVTIAMPNCPQAIQMFYAVNLVGGMINHDNFSVSGMEALRFVSEINIDIAFMVPSCVSISCGFTCGNYSECEMKKFILAKAMRKIVLMDSTKLGKSLPYTFCHAEDIDVLITDDELPRDFRDQLEKNNVKIIIPK